MPHRLLGDRRLRRLYAALVATSLLDERSTRLGPRWLDRIADAAAVYTLYLAHREAGQVARLLGMRRDDVESILRGEDPAARVVRSAYLEITKGGEHGAEPVLLAAAYVASGLKRLEECMNTIREIHGQVKNLEASCTGSD